MTTPLSQHAAKRRQQRGIPEMIIEWILQYGATEEQNGATRHYLDKRSRKQLARYTGGLSNKCGHWLDVCVVVGPNNRVVTTYFRDARLKSNH
jgi:hypothetical protein